MVQHSHLKWSRDEVDKLKRLLLEGLSLKAAAQELERPYWGVAVKASTLETTERKTSPAGKAPRGMDKKKLKSLIKDFDQSHLSARAFCRKRKIPFRKFVSALQHRDPEWFSKSINRLGVKGLSCPGCGSVFYQTSTSHKFCSSRCTSRHKRNLEYFDGARLNAVGIVEGVCQLCFEPKTKGLSAHHMVGKGNDPTNRLMVALCVGCHQAVTILSMRSFLENPEGWERLISLVQIRKLVRRESFNNVSSIKTKVNWRTLSLLEYLEEDGVDPEDLQSFISGV